MTRTQQHAALLRQYNRRGIPSRPPHPGTWEEFAQGLEEEIERGLDSDWIVASCNCMTKTPYPEHHRTGCKYRLIMERDAARSQRDIAAEALKKIVAAHGHKSDPECNCEDCIHLRPIEAAISAAS